MGQAVLEVFIVVAVVAASVALHAFLQQRVKSDVLRRHNDVAGYLFSAVGVIYAVVLGFVVVVVWEKYDATVANVDQEIASVSDLYRGIGGLPDPVRSRIRGELMQYTNDMINVEWPLMASRTIVEPDLRLLETIAHQVDTFQPKTMAGSNGQQVAQAQVQRLFDSRRERLIKSSPSVPLVLWFALFAGAFAMLFFAYLFGVENRPAQLVMTAVLAGLIAILFIVIAEFDSPFSGSVAISSDGWQIVQQHLRSVP